MSVMSASKNFEFWVLRQQTQYFIEADPVEISLIPKAVPVEQADGGLHYTDATPRAAQLFRLVNSMGDFDGIIPTQDGSVAKFNFVLVGRHDADVAIGDHWTEGNSYYEVTSILVNNHYEKKAAVISYGTDPDSSDYDG